MKYFSKFKNIGSSNKFLNKLCSFIFIFLFYVPVLNFEYYLKYELYIFFHITFKHTIIYRIENFI